jgi:superfamily II DNA or RNA helicase
MSFIPAFDEDVLIESIPAPYLERGRRYARDGRVLVASQDPSGVLVTGRVRGSAGRIYQCVARFVEEGDGRRSIVGHCSCPVGYNCKHIAAVILSLEVPGAPGTARASARALPLELQSWLDRVERAREPPADEPYRLLYLVYPEIQHGIGRTLVRAVRVRCLQSGGYGKPQDFNLTGQSRASYVAPDDQRIMALVSRGHGGGDGPVVRLDDLTGADVMRAIVRTGRGYFRSTDGPALRDAGSRGGRLLWQLGEDARLHVVFESDRPGLVLLPLSPPWYLDPESGDAGPVETGLGDREAGLLAAAPAVAPETVPLLNQAVASRLKGHQIPLPPEPPRRREKLERPQARLRLASVDRAASSVNRYWGLQGVPDWAHYAVLDVLYRGTAADPRDPTPSVRRVEDGALVEITRDSATERAYLDRLQELGFRPAGEEAKSRGVAFERPDPEDWIAFVQDDLPRLAAQGWQVEVDPSFHFRLAEVGGWDIEIEEGEGGRWLDLALGVEIDGERQDLLPLLVDLIHRYRGELSSHALAALDEESRLQARLPDGRLVLLPVRRIRPMLSTLIELYDSETSRTGKGRVRLNRIQAGQLAALEDADPALRWRGGEAARAWGRRLREAHALEQAEAPEGLTVALRAYQRQGLDWLQFLREFGLGGVLADDMGLGKTIQSLAHLLVEIESGRADRPSLVVAPTSLLFNWRREAERFAPRLRVLSVHGVGRHARFAKIPEHDLVLTTYALLHRDIDRLAAQSFHLLILDEAQAIKNPRSKSAQAVRSLNARHRLCLTGTPMENHLGELWALMDFLMPDLLGDERRFRRVFRTPIERDGDQIRQEALRRRVAPFLLRRTKEAVAAELPPKSEIIREVALEDDQRDLYETLRLALHEKVRAEVERKGLARSGIIILDALLKLRQVCCDPRLVSLESARRVRGSAKLDLLMTLLPELLAEGRRVLLFSQFTSMLALIEEELIQRGFQEDQAFVKLTGRTRHRDVPVDRFQSGEVPLFLISLKAGGTGLNLTAADTVIHYDPWWNPAAERQATDRAHRIGQDKPVFVYKLLTEGTVEQRVAELQARKQALADAMLEGGGAAAGALSADDLDLLFSPLSDL